MTQQSESQKDKVQLRYETTHTQNMMLMRSYSTWWGLTLYRAKTLAVSTVKNETEKLKIR